MKETLKIMEVSLDALACIIVLKNNAVNIDMLIFYWRMSWEMHSPDLLALVKYMIQ